TPSITDPAGGLDRSRLHRNVRRDPWDHHLALPLLLADKSGGGGRARGGPQDAKAAPWGLQVRAAYRDDRRDRRDVGVEPRNVLDHTVGCADASREWQEDTIASRGMCTAC